MPMNYGPNSMYAKEMKMKGNKKAKKEMNAGKMMMKSNKLGGGKGMRMKY